MESCQPTKHPLLYGTNNYKFRLFNKPSSDFIVIKKCVLNGATDQFRASISWSSGFEAREVLLGEVVSHSPNPQRGGLGLCIYDPQRQGGVCCRSIASQVLLNGSKQLEITGSEYSEDGP